jgi:glycopeptide antibiotics resistance protein
MSAPFGEVPVLPVVIPVAVVIFVGLLWRLRRRGLLTAARVAVALALCVYAAGVVGNTVFPIFLAKPAGDAPWTAYLALLPFTDYELEDAIMNILVFVPVGILVPLLIARASWWRVAAVAAAFSLAIELAQLAASAFLGGGHITDVNDFLSNVAGGLLGYGLFLAALRLRGMPAFVDRFRWAAHADAEMPDRTPKDEKTPA